ncbi:AAA family ATPase [Cellvibrio sp. ARAG 10.3]|uniref:AAA family ATPase n=1 Tax=Cellvibrio sp. ARAG 10.3 TaxID=3451358 RepID=UPI003F44E910
MIIGLFLKHIKAYKGINFVPVGHLYKFVTYVGENGSGKSSILEALDSFFNNKMYPINKGALSDGINTIGNEPFVAPVFLIEKTKLKNHKKQFELLSDYFWRVKRQDLNSAVQGSMKEFFELRELLMKSGAYSEDSHYLFIFGEQNLNSTPKPYFASFHGEEGFLIQILELNDDFFESTQRRELVQQQRELLNTKLSQKDWRSTSIYLKEAFSYVYFPVEIEVESFTKIETQEMQKIFDKKLKDEIEHALTSVNFTNQGGINKTLDDFVQEIENILNKEYCYDTGQRRNNSVTKSDLVNKIIEVYFQKRVLNKQNGDMLTKVRELSAGEKRQALINLVYAFLKRNPDRETMVIVAIDEPENSLHTALCYDQFEKLKEVSELNQIIVTTHWYGFLPVVSQGYGHFLNINENKISFETYDLYHYRSEIASAVEKSGNKIPNNFILKSTYDLVQSIFYSLKSAPPYNWIVCEGISEKIYFEYFFSDEIKNKRLRILPMGGQSKVIRLYKYLLNPVSEDTCQGKVFCIIDTDQIRCEEIRNGSPTLTIKRLSNKGTHLETELLTLDNSDTSATSIESALNPILFKNTIDAISVNPLYKISHVESEAGNTDFIKNFRNLDLDDFFKQNKGENKIVFAREYVEQCKQNEDKKTALTPGWIAEIRRFFT